MAYESVVKDSLVSEMEKFVRQLSAEKGKFRLFMLLEGTDSPATDSWTLIVSAPWLDTLGARGGSEYLARRLKKAVKHDVLSRLLRISVWETSSEFVLRIVRSIRVVESEEPVILNNAVLADFSFARAAVFVSDESVPGS